MVGGENDRLEIPFIHAYSRYAHFCRGHGERMAEINTPKTRINSGDFGLRISAALM
jgi:hypothetical protein